MAILTSGDLPLTPVKQALPTLPTLHWQLRLSRLLQSDIPLE